MEITARLNRYIGSKLDPIEKVIDSLFETVNQKDLKPILNLLETLPY